MAKEGPATLDDLLKQAKTTNRLLAAQLKAQMSQMDVIRLLSDLGLTLLCHLRSGAFRRKLSSMCSSRRLWITYSSPMISRTQPRTTGSVGRGVSVAPPRSTCKKVNATAVSTTWWAHP